MFHQVVDRLVGAVREPCSLPGRYLLEPAGVRAFEAFVLERASVGLEVEAELRDKGGDEVGVGDVVDGADDLVGVSGHADRTVVFAVFEQAAQFRVGVSNEAFEGGPVWWSS